MRKLSRSRIQGVSFHRQKPPLPQGQSRSRGAPNERKLARLPHENSEDLDPFLSEHAAPAPLTAADIHALLGDFGRQTLHTLVSDAVDAAVRWKQIAETLEKNQRLAASSETVLREETVDAVLGARRTWHLWKHRLEILSLIADAQVSLLGQPRKRTLQ
jgi:hypothetical protein